jgi:hypothetical protein
MKIHSLIVRDKVTPSISVTEQSTVMDTTSMITVAISPSTANVLTTTHTIGDSSHHFTVISTESTTALTFSLSATSTPLMQPYNDCVPVISIPITALLTALLTTVVSSVVSSLVTYYCCLLKQKYSYSPTTTTGPGGVAPTGERSDIELKNNTAYGQVTVGGSTVYETVN